MSNEIVNANPLEDGQGQEGPDATNCINCRQSRSEFKLALG